VKQFTGDSTAPVTQSAGNAQPGGLPDKPDPVKAELALAKEAFDQGKFDEPAGESALDLYRSALALDPNSESAKAGIRSVADKILERAETALTAERLEVAILNIEKARDIDASHPRLTFLDMQIGRERERLKLTQAQEVGNRVRTLVAQAKDRVENGRLATPTNGSAVDSLLEARRLDPTDTAAVQTIRDLSATLTEEGRKSLTAGNLDEAQVLLNGARRLGSAGAALSLVERELADAVRKAAPVQTANAGSNVAPAGNNRGARAVTPSPPTTTAGPGAGPNVDPMIADVKQRLSQGMLIDPPGGSARDAMRTLREAAPNRPEVEELSRALTTRLLDTSKQAMAAKQYDRAAQFIAAARDVGARYNEGGVAQAEAALAAARDQAAAATVVSSDTLKRTKMVLPEPSATALKKAPDGGWVELSFTVRPNGSVGDVEARNSSPTGVFDDAAVRAVRQWRFEPVERNGEKIAQRAQVRLKFAPPTRR